MNSNIPEGLEDRVLFTGTVEEAQVVAAESIETFAAPGGLQTDVRSVGEELAAVVAPAAEAPNTPIGVAKGVFPGRVGWVYDPAAAKWNGTSGHWWDDAATDQTAVDSMMSRGLKSITGAADDAAAWEVLFRSYNKSHGRGDVGYQAGEKIAIKINLNNSGGYSDTDNQLDASPHTILAMLRQLVNKAGVPQNMITLYDAVRPVPDRIYTKVHNAFPNVTFVDSTGTNGRVKVQWQSNAIVYSKSNGCGTKIPTVVRQATYLVNMALFKGHNTAGVTLTAKNHYGSIDAREHTFIKSANQPMGTYSPFVDLIGNKDLGGKTILFMIDGLYGTSDVNNAPEKWKQGPFNNRWTSSFFMSQDPVAIDSVAADFLLSEFAASKSYMKNADNFLHEAAQADAPASKTVYRQNGVNLASLGVHEHWNDKANKQYSRNLGTGNGIELFTPKAPTTVTGPAFLPDGAEHEAYPSQTFTSDGSATVTWSVTDGKLPPGMTLDSATGVYSGTPTAGGIFAFTVTATNNFGSKSKSYTHQIGPDAVTPTVQLGDGADRVHIERNEEGDLEVRCDGDGGLVIYQLAFASIDRLTVKTGGGDDQVDVIFMDANPVPAGGIQVDGESGSDSLAVEGFLPWRYLTVGLEQVRIDDASIGGSGLEDAFLRLPASVDLASVELKGGRVEMAGSQMVMQTDTLEISGGGALDLTGNALRLRSTPERLETDATNVFNWIKAGRGSGDWSGHGLTSSAAGANPFTGLAMAVHSGDSTIVVKHTYNGDVNVDGVVNADDYFLIDSGYITQLGGYRNGDLNYDGVVNADDYFLVDSAYIGQSGSSAEGEVVAIQARAINPAVWKRRGVVSEWLGAAGLLDFAS